MKINIVIVGLLSVLMTEVINASEVKLDVMKIDEIKKSNKVLQKQNFHIERGIEKENIFFLKVKAISQGGSVVYDAFVDKKTDAVYFGSAFDKDGKQLIFPKESKVIKEGVAFSYGNGKKEIYLVTDPECPYCTKFEKESEGKLEDYTVHVIFLPLPFHKNAPFMIEWIMQGKNDAEKRERLVQIALKNSKEYLSLIQDTKKLFQYSPSTQKVVEKSLKAVEELGTRGTPTIYDDSFNVISWKKLVTDPKK